MKKIYLVALALVAGCFAANAQDDSWIQVGESDFSTGFWGELSDLYSIPVDHKMHVEFENLNDLGDNWHNWLLVFCNDNAFGSADYVEYAVVRCDNWAWGTYLNSDPLIGSLASNYDWENFMPEMNGSYVSMDIYNLGTTFKMSAEITAESGNTYSYNVESAEGDFSQLGVFFTIENACIFIDPESIEISEIYTPEPPAVEGIIVGNTDLSSGFWSSLSDLYSIPTGDKMHVEFQNYNDLGDNWHNWLLVFCNDIAFGAEGYVEYSVVRCDNWAWGTYLNSDPLIGTFTSNYNWENFMTEMNGSTVSMDIYNLGTQFKMEAVITAESGNVYNYSVESAEGDFTNLGVFFTIENSFIVIDPESISLTSGIASVAIDENAPVEYYDLQGRKLNNPAEGTMCIRRQGTKAQVIVK